MLVMALSGAAVLALVCWAALRETASAAEPFIPQRASRSQMGGPPDRRRHVAPPRPPASGFAPQPGELDDATVADADTDEALAAAAALWNVLTQDRR
jgi:hypothetical protein